MTWILTTEAFNAAHALHERASERLQGDFAIGTQVIDIGGGERAVSTGYARFGRDPEYMALQHDIERKFELHKHDWPAVVDAARCLAAGERVRCYDGRVANE